MADAGTPGLPDNWRSERGHGVTAYQRNDADHYITRTDPTDGPVLVVLLSQGDRPRAVPLAWRRVEVTHGAGVIAAVCELANESNRLLEVEERTVR